MWAAFRKLKFSWRMNANGHVLVFALTQISGSKCFVLRFDKEIFHR